jgi:hypothetical protein
VTRRTPGLEETPGLDKQLGMGCGGTGSVPHPPDTRLALFLPRCPEEAGRVLTVALGGKVLAHRWAKQLLEALS